MTTISAASRTGLFALSIAVLAAASRSQSPCQADFDGNVFMDNVSMGGPNYTDCIKTTAKSALVVLAVQVFTGERTGTSTVGIWDHDATKDEPKSELARGSFSMNLTNGWQGAQLDKPVVLAKDQTFWVSWIPVNGCQASVEASGRTLPGIQVYKWSPTNSAPWNGPYQGHQWKFRLWCSRLPGVDRIGASCSDGNGKLAVYDAADVPFVGNAGFSLSATTLPPSAPALAVLGVQKNYVSFDLTPAGAPGCFLHTDFVIQAPVTTGSGAPSSGILTLPLPIPNDNTLKGFFLRSQVLVADPTVTRPLQVVFTNGVGITVQ
ncbi:MAG: DUF4082 domain-containing protein [Planctomycetes bacterium]|nr:DUF4082 domain-containing protein [Planctomycetota bacterium]MCB9870494.1 DUF4082 domain-containing protein [Planctomycetota bacterium]